MIRKVSVYFVSIPAINNLSEKSCSLSLRSTCRPLKSLTPSHAPP